MRCNWRIDEVDPESRYSDCVTLLLAHLWERKYHVRREEYSRSTISSCVGRQHLRWYLVLSTYISFEAQVMVKRIVHVRKTNRYD